MKKRLLSWLLILALCLSLLPAAALAEDAPEQTEAPTVQERTESVQTVNDTAAQATCQITIRKLNEDTFTLDVELTETVRSVKEKIQKSQNIPMENQELILGKTTQLKDDKTLAEYNIQAGSTINLMIRLASHKSHPICGAAHTNIGDHTADKCANVTWTAWNGVDAIPYDSNNTAYVYLSGNAKRTETLEIKNGYTLYLCLNGYSLTKTTEDSTAWFEGVITIYKGAQFTLCDCRGGGKITHTAACSAKACGAVTPAAAAAPPLPCSAARSAATVWIPPAQHRMAPVSRYTTGNLSCTAAGSSITRSLCRKATAAAVCVRMAAALRCTAARSAATRRQEMAAVYR